MSSRSRTPIGQLLVQAGFIDGVQLQNALSDQQRLGGRLGAALVKRGYVSEPTLLAEVARQQGVPYVQIADRPIPPDVLSLVPERLIRKRRMFPIVYAARPRRGLLVVATSDPENLEALDEIAFATGLLVRPALASDEDVSMAIERYFGRGKAAKRPASATSNGS